MAEVAVQTKGSHHGSALGKEGKYLTVAWDAADQYTNVSSKIDLPKMMVGDTAAREKVVRVACFQPWDWVIGVGSYVDEFYQAKDRVDVIGRSGNVILSIVLLVAFLVASATWYLVARGRFAIVG